MSVDAGRAAYLRGWAAPGWEPCATCMWARLCTRRRLCWRQAVQHVPPACGTCAYVRPDGSSDCAADGHCWLLLVGDAGYQAWDAAPQPPAE